MIPLTTFQKSCIEKARRYKPTMNNSEVRRLYLHAIKDGYISATTFINMITGNNVYQMNREIINKEPIKRYINNFETEILGKAQAMEKIQNG